MLKAWTNAMAANPAQENLNILINAREATPFLQYMRQRFAEVVPMAVD
jgi:hypothetical protein